MCEDVYVCGGCEDVCVKMYKMTTSHVQDSVLLWQYHHHSHRFPPSSPSPPSPAWPSAVPQSSSWSPALVGHVLPPFALPLSLSPPLPTLSGAQCLADV